MDSITTNNDACFSYFPQTCLTSKKLMFFKYVQWKMRWINNEIFTVLAPSFSICLALIGSKSNLGMLLVIVVLTSFYHVANAQYIHEISAVIIFSKVTIPVLNAAFIFSKCINWFKCSHLSNLQVTSKYWQGFFFFPWNSIIVPETLVHERLDVFSQIVTSIYSLVHWDIYVVQPICCVVHKV